MKQDKRTKKKIRNSLSYRCVGQFYKFMDSLGDDIIIVTMDCKLTSYDRGAVITARLAKPFFNAKDDCVEDYQHGDFLMKWDRDGKLIRESKNFPWEA